MPLLLCCTILVALNLRTDKLFLVPPAGFEPAIYTLKGCCPGPLDDGGQLRALLYQGSAILPTALRRTAHPARPAWLPQRAASDPGRRGVILARLRIIFVGAGSIFAWLRIIFVGAGSIFAWLRIIFEGANIEFEGANIKFGVANIKFGGANIILAAFRGHRAGARGARHAAGEAPCAQKRPCERRHEAHAPPRERRDGRRVYF